MSSSARGHHICDNHASRLHLSSELKHPTYATSNHRKSKDLKPSECFGERCLWRMVSLVDLLLVMLAAIKLLHVRSKILGSGDHLCQYPRFSFSSLDQLPQVFPIHYSACSPPCKIQSTGSQVPWLMRCPHSLALALVKEAVVSSVTATSWAF